MFVLAGCASQVEVIERGDRDCGKRVLIATQQSAFKDAVVAGIVEKLGKDSCYVKVIDLKKLAGESIAHYDALVIVTTCKMWRLNRHVRKFFKHLPEKDEGKIILLTTIAQKYDSKMGQVDAITSASKMEQAGVVAESIVGKVRALLAREIGS
jgi:menaquinone-dependent protoporphyrinogen IX oxidase